jgi:hypothetical protein
MKFIASVFLVAFFVVHLHGFSADYKITSIGLKVADLSIRLNDISLTVHVKNSEPSRLFPKIDNLYSLSFVDGYSTSRYSRIVNQESLSDSIMVVYHSLSDSATVWQRLTGTQHSYPLYMGSRDFFSGLVNIIRGNRINRSLFIDGNGKQWEANVEFGNYQQIRTPIGKFETQVVQLTFSPISTDRMPYLDMLTHNFLSPDSKLTLWISDNGVPIKATIKKKLMTVNWEIIQLRNEGY